MATTPTQKFTTTTTGATNQRPVAVLAVQKIDALLGSIIQLDGRQSYDPEKQLLSWYWSFVQVPIGSELKNTVCVNIELDHPVKRHAPVQVVVQKHDFRGGRNCIL